MPDAFACLTAFVMLSATTKYAPASTASGEALVRRPDDPDRQRRAVGERSERRRQPALGEDRRMQAAGELAQLLHRHVELPPRAGDELLGPVGVGAELVLEHAELDRERDETLLRAVVEVALEAAALVQSGLEDAKPRRVELLAPLGALEAERDELREVAEATLGVRAERVGRVRRDEDEPPRPAARDDGRRDRGPVAVLPHHRRGLPAHAAVVVDPR